MRREKLLKTIPLDRLMDLKFDFAFKQLFGIEKNKEITIVFLNAILQRTNRDKIKDISFKDIEVGGEYEDDKQSRLDILAVTNSDEWINIEIQFTNQYDMVKRSLFYWARVYQFPLEKSMPYKKLNPVIAINILNFYIFDQTERFHTTYHLYEDAEKFKLTDVMELHFLEMPKLIRDWQAGKLDPWNNVLARWLLMLGMVDHRKSKVYEDIFKELEAIAMKDEVLREAFTNWEALSGTLEERLAYEARLKQVLDDEAKIVEAEMRGEERGEKRGEKIGEERGEKRGIQKGIEQMALRLLANGMDLKAVAEITELSEERIQKLTK